MKTSAKRQKVNALNKSLIKHDEGINNKEYLDAFDPDESAGGVNADQEERQFEDVPLYDGAPISMAVSMLLIVRDLSEISRGGGNFKFGFGN